MNEEKKELADSTKNAQIKTILPRHRELMRKLVEGATLQNAAADLGYSVSRASIIANSPLFQDEMRKMETEADERVVASMAESKIKLKECAEKAVEVLKAELESDKSNIRVQAAKEVLDRVGLVKEDKLRLDAYVEPSPSFLFVLERALEEGKLGKPKQAEQNPGIGTE